jgi:glycosyltransferase involved in cell wall biosynthesis
MPPDAGPNIVFLGFNDPRRFIRGVENVIKLLADATTGRCYYVYRGEKTEVHRWGKMIAVSVPSNYLHGTVVLNGLVRRLKRRRKILVHGHSYYLTLMYFGRSMMFTIHDALAYLKAAQGSKLVPLFRLIEFMVYLRARRIHSNSKYTFRQAAFATIFEHKNSIIYCSDPAEPTEYDWPAVSGEPTARDYYFAVRSIEERAHIGLLINVAEYLQRSASAAKIVIAGKGPLLSHYRQEVKRRGLHNIELRGYVSDAERDALYRGARCVLVPALYGEGFGLPIIEAYARGIPVAASNVCAIPEVVFAREHLFENDVASVLTAVDLACSVPADTYAAYYHSRFGASRVIRQYRNFYSGLCDSRLETSA